VPISPPTCSSPGTWRSPRTPGFDGARSFRVPPYVRARPWRERFAGRARRSARA